MLLSALACLPRLAHAQSVDNWTSTSSSLWSTSGDWSAGAPTNLSIATFNTVAGLSTSLQLVPTAAAYSLNFSNAGGSNAYTFDAAGSINVNTLTLTAGMTSSDTGALTFYNQTTLGANQSWTKGMKRRPSSNQSPEIESEGTKMSRRGASSDSLRHSFGLSSTTWPAPQVPRTVAASLRRVALRSTGQRTSGVR